MEYVRLLSRYQLTGIPTGFVPVGTVTSPCHWLETPGTTVVGVYPQLRHTLEEEQEEVLDVADVDDVAEVDVVVDLVVVDVEVVVEEVVDEVEDEDVVDVEDVVVEDEVKNIG